MRKPAAEDRSKIEWTEYTWNPWQGCHHASPGCDNCYMFSDLRRHGRDPENVVRSKTTFDKPLEIARKHPEGRVIFTCSWSDWFLKEADPWRDEAWDIIRRTPQNTYLILTKRHGRMARCLPPDWGDGYPNVALGVSVENQEWADARVPVLLRDVKARWKYVSYEPALGPVRFSAINDGSWHDREGADLYDSLRGASYWRNGDHGLGGGPKLDLVIIGGESGGGARANELQWTRDVLAECRDAGVAGFNKQNGVKATDGGKTVVNLRSRKGGDILDIPADLRVRQLPPGMNPRWQNDPPIAAPVSRLRDIIAAGATV